MSYLIDTNVISELVRPQPNPKVVDWFAHIPNHHIYISVLTLGEICKGVESMKNSARQSKLLSWLEIELPAWFDGRILPIDEAVADRWGILQAQLKKPLPAIDSLIAATALHHKLNIVTRNHPDFDYPSLQVINPWKYN